MKNKIVQLLNHDGDLLALSSEGKIYRRPSRPFDTEDYWVEAFLDLEDSAALEDQFYAELNEKNVTSTD